MSAALIAAVVVEAFVIVALLAFIIYSRCYGSPEAVAERNLKRNQKLSEIREEQRALSRRDAQLGGGQNLGGGGQFVRT